MAIYSVLAVTVHPAFALGAILTAIATLAHHRTDFGSLASITRNELRVILLGIAAGQAVSVVLAPVLWPLLPLAVLGYFAHLWAVSPPGELARAWRRTRRRTAEEGNSAGSLSEP